MFLGRQNFPIPFNCKKKFPCLDGEVVGLVVEVKVLMVDGGVPAEGVKCQLDVGSAGQEKGLQS